MQPIALRHQTHGAGFHDCRIRLTYIIAGTWHTIHGIGHHFFRTRAAENRLCPVGNRDCINNHIIFRLWGMVEIHQCKKFLTLRWRAEDIYVHTCFKLLDKTAYIKHRRHFHEHFRRLFLYKRKHADNVRFAIGKGKYTAPVGRTARRINKQQVQALSSVALKPLTTIGALHRHILHSCQAHIMT